MPVVESDSAGGFAPSSSKAERAGANEMLLVSSQEQAPCFVDVIDFGWFSSRGYGM